MSQLAIDYTPTNLEKITRCIIQPMLSMWGAATDEYMAKAYLDELHWFTEDVLTKAMKNLRKNNEKKPSLSKIIKECYTARDLAAPQKVEIKKNLDQGQIDEVMQGYVGRKAISEGWWWALYEFLKWEAKTTFITDDEIAALIKKSDGYWSRDTMEIKIQSAALEHRKTFDAFSETLWKRRAAVSARYGIAA